MNDRRPDEWAIELLREAKEILESERDPLRAADELFAVRASFLTPYRADHGDVHAETLDRFGEALDALELAIALCWPLERTTGRWAYDDSSDEGWGSWVVTDLFRSGLLTAGEVLVLMRAGFQAGAIARWRALHETTTKAEFISRAGSDLLTLAERFVRHEELRGLAEMERRQADPSLALPKARWKEIHARIEGQASDFGPEFRGDHGWAHDQLLRTSASYKVRVDRGERSRGPTFGDLESAVRGDTETPRRWDLLYAQANAAVHGAPRASIELVAGVVPHRISGPRAADISELGIATACRLAELAWAFEYPDFGVPDVNPYVGTADKVLAAIVELSKRAERTFEAA